MPTPITIAPCRLRGKVIVPPSKSHAHRLLIANFLAGERAMLEPADGDNADIQATKRCLKALAEPGGKCTLDCGESGSTLRFLAPLAAALGKKPEFVRRGRLAERPFKAYETLEPGVHELAGNVSSQFVTGLLFALPLLKGDSEIRFTTPLESKGYVEMTLRVVRKAGIVVEATAEGYHVPGSQIFKVQSAKVEGDWSGAAFWYGANALGNDIEIDGLDLESAQPDRVIDALAGDWPETIDVSECPDNFPILAVMAADKPKRTVFTGIRRLRLKECDRVAAMAEVLTRFGVQVEVTEGEFAVRGTQAKFKGGEFPTQNDHRIAMAIAIGATRAGSPVTIDNADCAAKSYPTFFREYLALSSRRCFTPVG